MRYSTLLFDLDHTLFDSDTSEARAYDVTMKAAGVAEPSALFETYRRINLELWAGVERGDIQPIEVRTLRFERMFSEVGIEADVEDMASLFVRSLGTHGELYPGAVEVLDQVAEHARLALVTNGLSDVQRARLHRVGIADRFDAVVVSSEVGVNKPGRGIFDVAFAALGHPSASSALMIGDSLTSDIAGGSRYGLATCWYNPHGRSAGPDDVVTHEIRALEELPDIVRG